MTGFPVHHQLSELVQTHVGDAIQPSHPLKQGHSDTLEEGMATSSILAWRIPMDMGVWWATMHGVTKSQT